MERVSSAGRIALARATGTRVGTHCILRPGAETFRSAEAHRRGMIVIGDRCEIGTGALLHPYGGAIDLKGNVYVGPYVAIYGHGTVEIGESTLLSMHCCVLSSNHAIPPAGTLIRSQPDILRPTKIGRDVWLGAGVTVLGGVTIGDGCVVGAGAVVTKDLAPYSIALGVPARVIGNRG